LLMASTNRRAMVLLDSVDIVLLLGVSPQLRLRS
jgi:hypothetical protein